MPRTISRISRDKLGKFTKLIEKLQEPISSTLPAIIEVPDLQIPDPVEGSPFQRRGLAECITDKHPALVKHKIYRIEELSESDDFLINDEDGRAMYYPSTSFGTIDHGPFRANDHVVIESSENVLDQQGTPIPDVAGARVDVIEATKERALVRLSGTNAWFNNSQLKMYKRSKYLDDNPFKKGDQVRVVKTNKYSRIAIGELYTVAQAKGDHVYLVETGDRYHYHNLFVKFKPKKKDVVKKKKFTISDEIRNVINSRPNCKLDDNTILGILKGNKLIGEDITVEDISKFTKGMFTW